MKFSLLMSVYTGENPEFLSQCLDSLRAQTVMPTEFILVKDGPLTEELEDVLKSLFELEPGWVKVVELPYNLTQGPARAEGLKAAQYDWVAIMDSDDICRPDRFEKQLEMIRQNPELGLIGSQIAEFQNTMDAVTGLRRVPLSHKDILRYTKKRNPFNQMTVMLKRQDAISAGNYQYFPGFEDYSLWARMIKSGVLCANSPDALVYARVGGGMYNRRRGFRYVRFEYQMQRELRALGFIGYIYMARNLAARIPARFLPERWLRSAYNRLLRK